jgi:hypothetical protein
MPEMSQKRSEIFSTAVREEREKGLLESTFNRLYLFNLSSVYPSPVHQAM